MKKALKIFFCLIICCVIAVAPVTRVYCHAEFAIAAVVCGSIIASVATGYVIGGVSASLGGDPGLYGVWNDACYGFIDDCKSAATGFKSWSVSVGGRAWNAMKSWWSDKFGAGTEIDSPLFHQPTFETPLAAGDNFIVINDFTNFNPRDLRPITTLERSTIVGGGSFPMFEYSCSGFHIENLVSYNTNATNNNYVFVYNAQGDLLGRKTIAPNYGNYGDWVIRNPVYNVETNRFYFYFTNENSPYQMQSACSFSYDELYLGTELTPEQFVENQQLSDGATLEYSPSVPLQNNPIPAVADEDVVVFTFPFTEQQYEDMTPQELYDRITYIMENTPVNDYVTVIDNPTVVTVPEETLVDAEGNVTIIPAHEVIPGADDIVTPAEALEVIPGSVVTPVNPVVDVPGGDMSLPKLILTKFPFCIPKDIYNFAVLFNGQAQVINVSFPFNFSGVEQSIVLDLSNFDNIATMIRWFTYIIFCVALAIMTKQMMF